MKIFKKILTTTLSLVIISASATVITNQCAYNVEDVSACFFNTDSIIIKVPQLSQEEYPTGCESVSTVMALNYQGYDVTIDDFIDNYLEMGEITQYNGKLYANNPNEVFIGNPRSSNSYGCYAPVICNAIESYAKEENLQDLKVNNLTGTSLQSICSRYIKNGTPVIVWATVNMQPSVVGITWNLIGTENETFTWISKEHCLLLVGYDKDYYYFNDPQQPLKSTSQPIAFDRKIVEKRYKELGSQAVVIINK